MSFFTQIKYFKALVIVLALTNAVLLFLLFKQKSAARNNPKIPSHKMQAYFNKQLGLDEQQAIDFSTARKKHLKVAEEVRQKIDKKRRLLLLELTNNNANQELVESLFQEISMLQDTLRTSTMEQFFEIHGILTHQQREQFFNQFLNKEP